MPTLQVWELHHHSQTDPNIYKRYQKYTLKSYKSMYVGMYVHMNAGKMKIEK